MSRDELCRPSRPRLLSRGRSSVKCQPANRPRTAPVRCRLGQTNADLAARRFNSWIWLASGLLFACLVAFANLPR
ncbi:hypothetical protein K431DRAFT_12519 [Polychaeton citri CBS 116435]|uniref:Uncharacterized protein n=1 Tax=Polychaeton citri CBS 116435 TaxID=1314669 RepID=A0A9P4PYX5_9PEZI|nr:hypothetical protein K431DRAFT_12519 [Polychaeton citri CBS 116435]